MQASKAWTQVLGLDAHFDGRQVLACRPETRTIFISHFDWFGVHLPKPAWRPHCHLDHLHVKKIQNHPNFQDTVGCSAYQLLRFGINQSDPGSDFSLVLTFVLAHNIYICLKESLSTSQPGILCFVCCSLVVVLFILSEALASCSSCLFHLKCTSPMSPSTCVPLLDPVDFNMLPLC